MCRLRCLDHGRIERQRLIPLDIHVLLPNRVTGDDGFDAVVTGRDANSYRCSSLQQSVEQDPSTGR